MTDIAPQPTEVTPVPAEVPPAWLEPLLKRISDIEQILASHPDVKEGIKAAAVGVQTVEAAIDDPATELMRLLRLELTAHNVETVIGWAERRLGIKL